MSQYTHLTITEREMVMVMNEQGKSMRSIAAELSRTHSTISRELKRNRRTQQTYRAHLAQRRYDKCKRNCGTRPKMTDPAIYGYIESKLNLRWSPEQISGRAKLDRLPFTISYATIYRAVDSGILPKGTKKLLRYKWKYGKRKSADNRGKIADTTSIRNRPAGATNRTRYGHWESDTVLGKRKTGCIATHVERKTGYLVAIHLPDRREGSVSAATIDAFAALPSRLKKSFTVDNGKEFADHKFLSESTGMDVFFCDPCSPWQRGTNENTNGLIRQFFPKGSSFADLPGGKLDYVVQLINERPRKRLGYKSPSEVVNRFFSF